MTASINYLKTTRKRKHSFVVLYDDIKIVYQLDIYIKKKKKRKQ